MASISDIADFLSRLAPAALAEPWDNVGLLVGDRAREVERVMTCLTITPATAAEAVARRAGLLVTHHPLPFRPLKQLTSDTPEGRLLLQLIEAGVAIYSAHTAFDSAARGINQQLAEGLGLTRIAPLLPLATELADDSLGSGRHGWLESPLAIEEFAALVKIFLRVAGVHVVGASGRPVRHVGVACGSGGELLAAAEQAGCDCLLTGEMRFHGCLEAEAAGMTLVLPGHFASERLGVESLATLLATEFHSLVCWASRSEADPLRWI